MNALRDRVRELLQTRYSRGAAPRVKSVRKPTRAERQSYLAGYAAAVHDVSRFGLVHATRCLSDMTAVDE